MSVDILDGYNLMFEYSLVPIGSRYWITNPKVGSRYLLQFKNENDGVRKIKITACHSTYVENPGDIIFDLSGIKCRINVYFGDSYELDTKMTLPQFKSMMERSSVWLVRNPLERFKSGVIQNIRQFYMDMKNVYSNKTGDWHNVFFIPNHAFHKDYPLNWTKFFELYPFDYDNDNSKYLVWLPIWKQFCEYFFMDMCRYTDIMEVFLGDMHTQPYLYQLNLLFREIGILDKLTILDISELNYNHNLLINEIGKVEYEKLKEKLINLHAYDRYGHKRSTAEFEIDINKSNGNLKDVNYKSLEDYFKKSDIYRWEMFTYLLLLKGKLPDDNKGDETYFSNDIKLLDPIISVKPIL